MRAASPLLGPQGSAHELRLLEHLRVHVAALLALLLEGRLELRELLASPFLLARWHTHGEKDLYPVQ
jgi:hypothetical protein